MRVLPFATPLALLLLTLPASALIKPDFTPVHLVSQSTLIVELSFEPVKDARTVAAVKRVIKGKLDAPKLFFDLSSAVAREHADDLAKNLKAHGPSPVILFVAAPRDDADNPDAPKAPPKAYLHVDNQWTAFHSPKANLWQLEGIDPAMAGTWQGGTDMLIRAVDYIQSDANADVPAVEGVSWSAAGPTQFAKFSGPVHAAYELDPGDGVGPLLYVACEAGDRLFRFDAKAKAIKDVTPELGLAARSKVSAWGNFSGDGRLGLTSWDGKGLTHFARGADGKFVAGVAVNVAGLAGDVRSLAAVDAGGRAGVVIGTGNGPVVWREGTEAQPLRRAADTKAGEGGGACVLADFDNDGLPDLIELDPKQSLIYRGKPNGAFDAPKPCKVTSSGGALPADFDADGCLDLFTTGPDRCGVWQNRGNFDFVESLALSGELAYKGNADITAGQAHDFNGDGRADLALFYSAATPPALFFNRGFRSFGFANALDLDKSGLIPALNDGQRAGCLADLNGDGVDELYAISAAGEGWALPLESAGDGARSVRVVLSPRSAGPLTVTAWQKSRCLGAWNLTPGGHARISTRVTTPETILLKWTTPTGQRHERPVTPTAGKPARVVLEP